MDDPCTRKSTGSAGFPTSGAPARFRYIHSLMSPFCAQYSLLQIFSSTALDFSFAPPAGAAKASLAALVSAGPPAIAGAAPRRNFRRDGRLFVMDMIPS